MGVKCKKLKTSSLIHINEETELWVVCEFPSKEYSIWDYELDLNVKYVNLSIGREE